jgi:GNAT superfamily N-acetyltransferase
LVESLTWDSAFFGFSVAKTTTLYLLPYQVDEVIKSCLQEKIKCLYCELHPDEVATVAAVQSAGFTFVEFRMVLEISSLPTRRGAGGLDPSSSVMVDDCPRVTDLPYLEQIATSIAPMSRFAVDTRFAPGASIEMYRLWLHNSLADPATTVLLAREESKPLGLLTLKQVGAVAQFVLFGVAPEARGRGVGAALMHAGIEKCRSLSMQRVELVTQGRNVGAVRLYERAGFTLAHVSYYFHKWFA